MILTDLFSLQFMGCVRSAADIRVATHSGNFKIIENLREIQGSFKT